MIMMTATNTCYALPMCTSCAILAISLKQFYVASTIMIPV